MKIYQDYLNTIKKAMIEPQADLAFNVFQNQVYKRKESLLPSMLEFSRELNLPAIKDRKLGSHPDFEHLKNTNNNEFHYITSVFLDIKGSTKLFNNYRPEIVFIITKTIQLAAIHTFSLYGGYIQRLHGDGLFVYFGGKSISPEIAINNSLLSSGLFSYFMAHDIKDLFEENGIEKIYTRIGIDYGEASKVLWAMAGIGEISEVTTTSLHTSLAYKMQSSAENNGVVVGANIMPFVFSDNYFTPVNHRTKKDGDRYIFENPAKNYRYTQFDFHWSQFLKKQHFIATDSVTGKLIFKKKILPEPAHLAPFVGNNKPYLSK